VVLFPLVNCGDKLLAPRIPAPHAAVCGPDCARSGDYWRLSEELPDPDWDMGSLEAGATKTSANPLIAKGDRDMAFEKDTQADIQNMIGASIEKSTKPLTDAIEKLQYENAMLKMSLVHKEYHDQLADDAAKKAFAAKSDADKDKEMDEKPAKKGLEVLPEGVRGTPRIA
jgi:hypothetical protein